MVCITIHCFLCLPPTVAISFQGDRIAVVTMRKYVVLFLALHEFYFQKHNDNFIHCNYFSTDTKCCVFQITNILFFYLIVKLNFFLEYIDIKWEIYMERWRSNTCLVI